jgi:hypothetical protein
MKTATITEGTKFTIIGSLEGQASRKFIAGKTGMITEVKTIGMGTKFETTTVKFQIEKDSTNVAYGGVCELEKFMNNISAI